MILKLTKHCHKAKSGTNHTHCIQENPYKTLDLAGWSNTDHNRQCRFSCKSKRLYKHALSLPLSNTHTSIYPNSHQSLLRFPKVRVLLQVSLEILKPLLQSAQWHESLCGVGHHLRLLHGKRRVVEETLQHFGRELHKRGDGRLAGGGHWRLLSQLSEGLHRDSDLGQVGLLEGQAPKLDLPISLAATCMNGGKSYRRGQLSQSMLRPTG